MHHKSHDQGVSFPREFLSGGSLCEGLCPGKCLCLWVSVLWDVSVQGGLCPGGVSVRSTPWTETPPYSNERGTTHPTGMHSCFSLYFVELYEYPVDYCICRKWMVKDHCRMCLRKIFNVKRGLLATSLLVNQDPYHPRPPDPRLPSPLDPYHH